MIAEPKGSLSQAWMGNWKSDHEQKGFANSCSAAGGGGGQRPHNMNIPSRRCLNHQVVLPCQGQ